jgi:hypothetical protein
LPTTRDNKQRRRTQGRRNTEDTPQGWKKEISCEMERITPRRKHMGTGR